MKIISIIIALFILFSCRELVTNDFPDIEPVPSLTDEFCNLLYMSNKQHQKQVCATTFYGFAV